MAPRISRRRFFVVPLALSAGGALAQVIEYESNGEKYQTLTRSGLTVIFTHLQVQVAGFGLLQVSIANGSQIYWMVKPEQFAYVRADETVEATSADDVVNTMMARASSNDVIKLTTSYEKSLYAIPNMRSNNGYEQRRQNALAFGGSLKIKAAAAASAITLAQIRLAPGDSTDGAVFLKLTKELKSLTGGHVEMHVENENFQFNPD